MEIGDILRNYRKEHDLSLREFSRISGVSNSYLSMLESGRHPRSNRPIIPTLTKLNQISAAMGMTVNDLISNIDGVPAARNKFSERIRSLRADHNLTQEELSSCLGSTKQAVSQWERGIREPDFATLEKIADYFCVDTDYLIGRSSRPAALDKTEVDLIERLRLLPEGEKNMILRAVGIIN